MQRFPEQKHSLMDGGESVEVFLLCSVLFCQNLDCFSSPFGFKLNSADISHSFVPANVHFQHTAELVKNLVKVGANYSMQVCQQCQSCNVTRRRSRHVPQQRMPQLDSVHTSTKAQQSSDFCFCPEKARLLLSLT